MRRAFPPPQQDLFFGERNVQARSQEACLDVQRISSRLAGGVPVGGEGHIQPSREADESGVVHRVLGIVNDLFGSQRDGMELVRVPFDECLREVFQIPEQGEAHRSVDSEFAADAHHLKDEQARPRISPGGRVLPGPAGLFFQFRPDFATIIIRLKGAGQAVQTIGLQVSGFWNIQG